MNLSKFHNKIPGLPEPIMYWNANRLTGADGSTVSSWTNIGTSGSTYDLQMSGTGTNSAMLHRRVGADRAHVAFVQSRLETVTPVPSTLAGLTSRTVGCLFKLTSTNSANIIGYGNGLNGGGFDILYLGSGHLMSPNYGGGQQGGGYPQLGAWITSHCRFTDLGNGSIRIDNFLDGILVETSTIANTLFNPPVSPFYIGQGSRDEYNTAVPMKIAAAYVIDRALTDQELAHMRALMLELKPFVPAVTGDTYVAPTYHDPGYSV
jgi:hypothetical protein